MRRSPLQLRPAKPNDIEAIIALTRASRRQLAEWSPVYFNPREAADENHANFLRFILGSGDHQTLVLTEQEVVVGFFTEIPQQGHLWIDDLCVTSETLWAGVVSIIADRVEQNWVTCVSIADSDRLDALSAAGLSEISGYYSLSIEPTGSDQTPPVVIPDYRVMAAIHTFGAQPFSPELPGALVVAGGLGFAVGSPSATPPIYDPGGPTCVIDQIHGDDQGALLGEVINLSARRGDCHIIVVCAVADHGLAGTLLEMGFAKVVSLQGTSPTASPTAKGG